MKQFIYRRKIHSVKHVFLSAILFVGILCLFLFCIVQTGIQTRQEQKKYLEQAIQRCVIQCYATEGRYPESLGYIEENYGLVYDKELFVVDYRVVGSNLRPEVAVLETGGVK